MGTLTPLSRPRRPPAEREVPSTTYALLGMLTFDEMSGYDLGKLVDESIAHLGFRPARSQVYATLRRLVALGWATEREVAQQDRPDKRVYRITPEGERALRRWLETPGAEPEVVRSPFLLKVFFGALIPRDVLLEQLREAHRRAVAELEDLEAIERELDASGREDLRFPGYVLQYGLAHNRASVAWTTEMLRQLAPADDPAPGPRRTKKASTRS